jgi:hypothetical protein
VANLSDLAVRLAAGAVKVGVLTASSTPEERD